MCFRTTTRTYRGETYRKYLLVESVQPPRGRGSARWFPLGDLSPRPRAAWLKLVHRVEEALVGQGDLFEKPDAETLAIVPVLFLVLAAGVTAAERANPNTVGTGPREDASGA